MRTSRGAIVGAIATSLIAVVSAMPAVATAPPASQAVALAEEFKGTFTAVTPARILDTREGNGAPKQPVGPGAKIDLQVTGRGGLPATGVEAVVLNVTVAFPSAWGHIRVWPTGVAMPEASYLNFNPGWVGANSVTVAVGTGGKVSLFNSGGNTHLVADVVGWYADETATATGGFMFAGEPFRHFDSRLPSWPHGKFQPGDWVTLGWDHEEDNPHVKAWAVNVTSTEAETPGFVTLWNGDPNNRPFVSTLNLQPGRVVPNFAIVPARQCFECTEMPGWSSIGVYSSGVTHLIVDVFAIYDDGTYPDGLRFVGNTPTRIVDSRTGLGTPGALQGGRTATITTPAALVDDNTWALALNLTAVAPSGETFMSVWPEGDRPLMSNLNPAAGQTVPNAVITGLTTDFKFNVYNNGGSAHFLVDVVGRFYVVPPVTAPAAARVDQKPVGVSSGVQAHRG